ncbi:LPP20 family lipoprotein [Thiomicrospira microaerophila]|uniref:LPP20 family lipoprotein n=1 Tax=Thiomicrospira microaerophila TaxID=406020 RepID=UPI0020104833|nr:LPP20 family lipoprotein [Thiomicrospira microaerophila]UQB42099.1 LPP20 family lipoprotein [Thiomicrospira microaerophila]
MKIKLGLVAIMLVFLSACANKQKLEQAESAQACEYQPGVKAPQWYCDPQYEGGLAAVGEAAPNPAGDNNMQRTVAMGNARDDLARQMEVEVKNMLENWTRTTGTGEAQTYEANIANVSRQVANQTLNGSNQLARWVAPDGTLVLLVGVKDQGSLRNSIKTSLRNEDALWQQFQSQQALQALDREIDKMLDNR